MRILRALPCFAALVLLAAAGVARAQPAPDPSGWSIFDEVRVGVLAHDVRFAGGREPGADINGELLFVSPVPRGWGDALPDWIGWLARPRPNLGGEVNTAGATDQAYAGLDWTIPLLPRVFGEGDRVTLDYDFGPSINDGHVNPTVPDRKALGSNVLFRLAGELGWHVTPRLGVFALFEHVSDAGLAKYNRSLNDFGFRVGWRF
jgi:hypothetical protein